MSGRPWSLTLAAGGLLLALQTVAACNSVLDIEPAQLGEITEGGACFWPIPDPTVDCKPCDACAGKCPMIDQCLADRKCRQALSLFRKCAGDTCADPGHHCDGCTSGNELAAKTAACLATCDCNPARVSTLCESYCACMDSRCHANEPGGSKNACLSACANGQAGLQLPVDQPDPDVTKFWATSPSPSVVYCFLQHCDRGDSTDDPVHCPHAVGKSQVSVCPEVQERGTTVCPFGKGYGNAPCNAAADCCSGDCDTTRKTCNGP